MVPSKTAALNFSFTAHATLTNANSARAQPTHKYKGFTRNQPANPSSNPAQSATQRFLRCRASSSNQLPPSTNHVAGRSAEGYAAYIANSGDNATRKLLAIAARQPKAVNAIPPISSNERNRSASHNTS